MNISKEAQVTLSRLEVTSFLKGQKAPAKKQFQQRLEQHFEGLFGLYYSLYSHRYDFYFHLQQLVAVLAEGFNQRPGYLKKLDTQRLKTPDWFQQENMLGMACYVDLFAGDLQKLQSRIPYLQELGVTYLHLMPLYKSPEGDSDGGYAVSDYRTVNPDLGTMDDLKTLAEKLSKAGISMVLDFVFNHTSDEHQWALAAKRGEAEFQEYYHLFPDRGMPDAYEQNLREIFPQVRRGNFTWDEQAEKWVWTTFNSFQWDLNYSNPAVFNAIVAEMLYLANIGCDVLRLDALAFIWKEMGTSCENQPKAHQLIQAFNSCLRISAPAVLFKSEAIVHPDEVVKYIAPEECQLSYNPLLMALLWNSLATRKTRLLTASMRKSMTIDPACSWVNYVRCHDDIGWTFDDDVAGKLGINGHDHRYFLNQFYTGRFEGSFAKGVPFQENPSTGDCRVCGTAASLTGLELALQNNDANEAQIAIKRIMLIHSVILSIGGIPLLWAGDEMGLLNDYSYQNQSDKQHDDRWVNRISTPEHQTFLSQSRNQYFREVYLGLQHLIKMRKSLPVLAQAETQIIDSNNQHVFSYVRLDEQHGRLLAVCNFSEQQQQISSKILDVLLADQAVDVLTDQPLDIDSEVLSLGPYQVMWLLKV
ncbi:MAG: alpha-amylase family glycosyl hydrolase [Aestuariibacter sp.]